MTETRLSSAPAFDVNELGVLFDSLPSGYACPVCGTDTWNVWQDNTGLVTAIPWATQQGDVRLMGPPVVTFACDCCGFIKQHDLGIFRKYLETLKRER